MDKQEFLNEVLTSRREWEAALASLTPEGFIAPQGRYAGWSIKDIIAHITWHEKEMIGMMERHSLEGSELWNLPTDERNGIIYEENRWRTLEDVLAEAVSVYARLLECIEQLSDEDLNDNRRYAGFVEALPDVPPWDLFAGNTYGHYTEHLNDLLSS